jgi:hypothetical protein
VRAANCGRSNAEEQEGWQFGSTFRPVAHRPTTPNRENSLADRLQKLYADQVHISSFLLTLYPGLDRRHPGRN